jgi:hypothetical protein
VTRPAKPAKPAVKAGGVKIFGVSSEEGGPVPTIGKGTGRSAPVKKPAPKPDEVASQIAQQLRDVYDDVLKQPVPERFLELLRQLESGSAPERSKDET